MLVEAVLHAKGRSVLTIEQDKTVGDAARALAERRVGAVVVVENRDRVVGILSERDIVRGLGTLGPDIFGQPVTALMTREVFTCTGADSLDKLMGVMTNRRFRHIPVVEDGRLAGIVSIGDVVKNKLDEAAMENDSLRHYIAAGR